MASPGISLKAEVLSSALPRIHELRDKIVVIKYGGSVIEEKIYGDNILADVVLLQLLGIHPIIVHGGGKAITNKMREADIQPKFIDGLRVTDRRSVVIVEKVLNKIINPEIVQGIVQQRGRAAGISGKKVMTAKKMYHITAAGKKVDIGFVGEITKVNKAPVVAALKKGLIPVISPVAKSPSGQTFNVNADVAAAKLACALKASRLIFISDVNGVLEYPEQPDSTIPRLLEAEVEPYIQAGVIYGGMLPKIRSALQALKDGVSTVKLIDGRISHAVLLDTLVEPAIGTEILLEAKPEPPAPK
jgi:acetylglutamate kinase